VVGVSTNNTTTIKYDSLIPITSLYEKDGFLFNIEGRLRKMNKVVAPKTNKRSLESFLAALLQFQAEELEEEV
jgi:NADH dehydrogenase/NADH:ubiquinone oxidoreductase subunit G